MHGNTKHWISQSSVQISGTKLIEVRLTVSEWNRNYGLIYVVNAV